MFFQVEYEGFPEPKVYWMRAVSRLKCARDDRVCLSHKRKVLFVTTIKFLHYLALASLIEFADEIKFAEV